MFLRPSVPAVLVLLLAGCPSSRTNTASPTPSSEAPSGSALTNNDHAAIGAKAPGFSLPDLDGKVVSLSSYAGKTIVLEWFNPQCPFIKVAHTHTLKDYGNELAKKGVVFLAIDSSAKGKQGSDPKDVMTARDRFGIAYPILLDVTGAVGKAYGATNTPHMFVIDPKGTLIYQGAIDDTQGGEPDQGEPVINYVERALTSIDKGTPLETTTTKAWGCSVKYGS